MIIETQTVTTEREIEGDDIAVELELAMASYRLGGWTVARSSMARAEFTATSSKGRVVVELRRKAESTP